MNASRMIVCSATSLAALAGLAVADTPSILELAPSDAVLVVSIDDYSVFRDSLDASALGAVINDPYIQEWLSNAYEEAMERAASNLESIGVDLEDLSEPVGTVGASLFLEGEGFENAEYQFLTVADFGDNVDSMFDVISKGIDSAVDEGNIEVEEDTYNGAEVWTITQLVDPETLAFFEEIGEEAPLPNMMYFARMGDGLMASSSIDALETSIDQIAGEAAGNRFITSDIVFSDALPEPSDADAVIYANFLPMYELAQDRDRARSQNPDEFYLDPDLDFFPILESTGLNEVSSVGVAIEFGTDNAAVESTAVVRVPERRGLMTLVPADRASFEPPAFVNADAVSLSMFQIDFQNLLPAIQNIIGSLPADMQQQIAMPLMMAQGFVTPLFANLGPEVYVVQNINKPYSADSRKTLVGINAKDSQALSAALSMLTMQIGLQPRSFEGFQIWDITSSPMLGQVAGPGMPEIAIGISGEHLFAGETAQVEDALRAVNADGLKLADEAIFRSSMANIPGDGLSFNWMNTKAMLEYVHYSLKNWPEMQRQQMIEMFGDDPETLEMIEQDMLDTGVPTFLEDLPDFDVIYENIGNAVGYSYITPEGIVFKGYLHNAN